MDIGAKLLPDIPENYPHFDAQELLYYASVSGDLEIFNDFVKSGATLPMDEEASAKIIEAIVGGKNPAMLMEAAGRAQYEIVNYLLARNADPNLKDANGNTALALAMEERRRKTKLWMNKVKLKDSFNQTILSLGGDPNVQVGTATTPVVTDRQSKGQY